MALHHRLLTGLVLGAAAGVYVNLTAGGGSEVQWIIANVTEPLGRVWLNALLLVIIPLVLSTLALGIARLGSTARIGRVAGLTFVCFVALTLLAAVIGVGLARLVGPGARFDETARQNLIDTYRSEGSQAVSLARDGATIDTFVNLVPRNPVQAMANGDMPGVIVIALMIGVALTQIAAARAEPMLAFLESLSHVAMRAIEMVMAVAPVAAALLIFSIASRLGLDVLASLSTYLMTIIVGLAILVFVAYPVVIATVGGRSPGTFFRSARVVVLTALATSSSSATLPMTVKATEHDLRVPREIAAFVVPLGATIHMNGTALATAVTVLFVAQVYGFDLTLAQHLSVALMSVVAAMSAGSVPGGAAPLVTMMLGMVGAPLEGIALVLGVERVLDMLRTSVDVTGDMVAATVVHRFAGVNEGTTI